MDFCMNIPGPGPVIIACIKQMLVTTINEKIHTLDQIFLPQLHQLRINGEYVWLILAIILSLEKKIQ